MYYHYRCLPCFLHHPFTYFIFTYIAIPFIVFTYIRIIIHHLYSILKANTLCVAYSSVTLCPCFLCTFCFFRAKRLVLTLCVCLIVTIKARIISKAF